MTAADFPRISVCIPNYNHGRYLAEALESVCTQSYSPHEVVVLDDCSTDDSVAVAQSCMERYPKLRLIRYPEKSADWLAAMAGHIPVLSGDYVLLLGADDYMYPGFFERAARMLRQHPQTGVVFGAFDMVSNQKRLLAHIASGVASEQYLAGAAIERRLCAARMFETGIASLIRRDALLWLIEQGLTELGPHLDGIGYAVAALRWGACYLPGAQGAFRMGGTARNYNQGILSDPRQFERYYAAVGRFLRSEALAPHVPPPVRAALERRLLGTVPLGGTLGLRLAHWLWSLRESPYAIVRGLSALAIKVLRCVAAAIAPLLTRLRQHRLRLEP